MNSKTFRRNHGPKLKSASSTFISLHFNKSDEDQIEISYKNDKKEPEDKSAFETPQSNFYVVDSKKDNLSEQKSPVCDATLSVNDVSKDSTQKLIKSTSFVTKPDILQPKQKEDEINLRTSPVTDRELKVSPAIEAAELVDSDSFSHYVNDELEKARPETPHMPFFPKDSDKVPISFYSVFVSLAQKSVRTHLLVAVLACVCAPIPSWLSGFLVGTILSSCVVYWLYKPQKSKRHCSALNLPPTEIDQKECGILKGWMNELPSSMSYSPERYHVSCTHSVYVRLEGSYVRFSFPQRNIPRRAMFNEPRHEMQFTHQQHFDVTDAVVELLPQGLNKKRLWSKKYPIGLRIPNPKRSVLSQAEGSKSNNKKDLKCVPRINENNEIVIYLFARTDRDKSLWHSRFLRASKRSPTNRMTEGKRTLSLDFAYLQNNNNNTPSEETESTSDDYESSFVKLSLSKQQKFEMYMSCLMLEEKRGTTLRWFNMLVGRLFFDFLVEEDWAQHVSEKIQKKLNRIKLPFFLAELSVKEINLGSALPKVHHASEPCIDERGLWIDMEVSYNGSFHMTLETKLNLDRFKVESESFSFTASSDQNEEEHMKSSVCESDEDSLESSSDEETDEEALLKEGSSPVSSSSGGGKKFLRLMDKLAHSSYFQHAAKNRYVKRAMDDLSNTPLVLTVEVLWLNGTLAINIPPWPTDRLWYGFRTNPSLSITARPKLGQHVVTFTQITEWIEKKLTSEFQKVLVMPNMDDLIIPIMQDVP